jgi:hypothetical protein
VEIRKMIGHLFGGKTLIYVNEIYRNKVVNHENAFYMEAFFLSKNNVHG